MAAVAAILAFPIGKILAVFDLQVSYQVWSQLAFWFRRSEK